jgi:alpha-tubulin suppressor-like RCC1 family protein
MPDLLYTPSRPVSPLPAAVGVAVSITHTCARTADSAVWCWGGNQFSELGVAPATDRHYVPTEVPGLRGVVELALGTFFSCARKDDGSVVCWGRYFGGAEPRPVRGL